MLRSQHILRLIIAGLVLAYVAIAAVQYSQYRSVEAVMRRGDVNALWSFFVDKWATATYKVLIPLNSGLA